MPVERIRQPSFAKGEIAPEFYGRSDLAAYAIALKTLRNFIVKPSAACASRPGTRLTAQTRGDGKALQVPFVYSDEDALVLCFTDHAVRFYRTDVASGLPGAITPPTAASAWDGGTAYTSGGYVSYAGRIYLSNGGQGGAPTTIGIAPDSINPSWQEWTDVGPVGGPMNPLELWTPYVEADLPRLRWAQVGDVVTLVHPNYLPKELVRTSASTWLLRDASTVPGIAAPWPAFLGVPLQAAPDSAHPVKEWGWQVTAILADGTESKPSIVLRPAATTGANSRQIVLYSDNPVALYWASIDGAVAYNVYRGRSGVMGWVGQASEVSGGYVRFRDDGDKPDYTRKPPRWTSVFTTDAWSAFTRYEVGDRVTNGGRVYECTQGGTSASAGGPTGTGTAIADGSGAAWVAGATYVVGAVVTNQGETYRCAVGGVASAVVLGPYDVLGGNISDGTVKWNWKGHGGAAAWKYVAEAPAQKKFPSVVGFYEGRRVFANTEEDPSSIRFSKVDAYDVFEEYSNEPSDGATSTAIASQRLEEIRALVPRGALIALTSSSEWVIVGAGQGETISPGRIAAHPGTEHGTSWTQPVTVATSVLFIQRKGAVPRAMIFSNEAGGYDTVDLSLFSRHLFDGRQIVRWAYAEDPWSVVWAVTDDGELLSLTFVKDQELVAWARHDLPGGLVEDVCTIPEGDEDAVYLVVKRGVHRYVERLATRRILDVKEAVCLDSSLTYRGVGAKHFSGLDHLEGQEIWVLADGSVAGPFTVAGGAFDLDDERFPDGASIVTAGIRFDCDWGSLPPMHEKQRVKAVRKVWVECEASRGTQAGPDFDHLEEWKQRDVSHGFEASPLETTIAEINTVATWKDGTVVIRQKDPLPLTILAVTREVEYGGVP
jgi:hypothetical protein